MKNAIAYYYNLYSYDIHHINGIYKFSVNDLHYVFTPYEISEINDIYELSQALLQSGIYIHQIIPNINNELYTNINNINYVLLMLNNDFNKKIELIDITNFNNAVGYIKFDKLNRQNWSRLWEIKIDYFEYQINQFGKKYPHIRDSFSYYVGLAETGISLYVNSKVQLSSPVVSHRRIKVNSTYYDLYNPLNLVMDFKVRDAAEYFKDLFLEKDNVFDEIIQYFSMNYLSTYDCFLFFVRMFFPSFYFDLYEDIVERQLNDNKIKKISEKTVAYEQLLKKLYIYLLQYINMPDIEWLKKT